MFSVNSFVNTALEEDIGSGDITTDHLVTNAEKGKGTILAKENLVVAGLNIARKVFKLLDPRARFYLECSDGDEIKSGEVVLEVVGKLSSLLKGERTALNFLQRLSGIATKTRRYSKELEGMKVKLLDTRKTTPGWRLLEKKAVRIGGGFNHRMGLYDGVLIKDNHIAVCGSISKAVNKLRNYVSHLIKIEVEVSSLSEVKDAIDANVDVIMLDNMASDKIKQAVDIIGDKALIEVSGNINLKNLKKLGSLGVNLISVGSITHSAKAVDLSMNINLVDKHSLTL